ncbi:MAG: HAD family hydrolase [Rhizobiaceae bacterium]|nr:HAD family hydrolase [Rhizobiaceae bacterium]MCV0406522.1 HAD family hydrolase [Rhizobiaceae bacterium]
MRPGLVIFDCDGVLVDSEPISISVLLEVFGEAGVAIDEQAAYARFLGRSMSSIGETLSAEWGVAMTAAHLEAIRARLYERFRAELKPVAHVADALDAISSRRCVASSSKPERIRLSLEVTGLLERLAPHLYSSTMVEHGKPAPDLFLHAAREMGSGPEECVVIEDSPAGIEAAKRAGMRVFAFTGGSHAGPSGLAATVAALRPDVTFGDMRLLPGLLAGAKPGRRAFAS